MIIWYDCPKCGLEDSSDGEHFLWQVRRRIRTTARRTDAGRISYGGLRRII
jgi:hypothetical protein